MARPSPPRVARTTGDPRCDGDAAGVEADVAGTRCRAQPLWMRGPGLDIANAVAWIPFALAAHLLERDRGALNALIAAVLLLSFVHQPLTVTLVYGDPEEFRLHRRLFLWAPVVVAAAIVIGRAVSPVLVAAIAGLWNAEHTLLQRYGLTRIYGRKVGDDQGGLERWMLQSWLALVVVWIAVDARTPAFLARIDLGERNTQSVEVLTSLRPVALVLLAPLAVAVGVLAVNWVRAERARGLAANPAKHIYVVSTAALLVVTLVDPIAGLVGYVAAHALEYFLVVHGVLGRRYAAGTSGGVLGHAVRARTGRIGFFTVYLIAVAALLLASRAGVSGVMPVTLLTLGGLHLLYDGFIWKLRRPSVASSLDAAMRDPVAAKKGS
jgi:hypothetical protein